MSYTVRLKKEAEKAFRKLNGKDQDRMFSAFDKLSEDPFVGKKLRGDFEGRYSIRIWPYRAVYEIYKNELLVVVIKIGHRKDVYR